MKRITAFIASAVLFLSLFVPSFAAEYVNFNINLVSEDDKQAVISIDYEGGGHFGCLDFQIEINTHKLEAVKGENGTGLNNFTLVANSKSGMCMALININSYPIKGTFASTVPFEETQGKDLFVITFNKKSPDKITTDDFEFRVTNCQSSDTKQSFKTSVTTDLAKGLGAEDDKPVSGGSSEELKPSKNQDKTDVSPTIEVNADNDTELTQSVADSDNIDIQTDEDNDKTDKKDDSNMSRKKTLIIVGAAALCMVFVIVTIILYVVKKTKGNPEDTRSREHDDDDDSKD